MLVGSCSVAGARLLPFHGVDVAPAKLLLLHAVDHFSPAEATDSLILRAFVRRLGQHVTVAVLSLGLVRSSADRFLITRLVRDIKES